MPAPRRPSDIAPLVRSVRHAVDTIDDQGARAIGYGLDWRGHLRSGGGGGSGGVSRPTETAATAPPDWTVDYYDRLSRALGEVHYWSHIAAQLVTKGIGHGDQIDSVGDENSRTGHCLACGRWCTGSRNDRLGLVRHERGNDRRYCPACFVAWRRHVAKTGGTDVAEFERLRSHGIERSDEDVT